MSEDNTDLQYKIDNLESELNDTQNERDRLQGELEYAEEQHERDQNEINDLEEAIEENHGFLQRFFLGNFSIKEIGESVQVAEHDSGTILTGKKEDFFKFVDQFQNFIDELDQQYDPPF